MFTDFAFWIWMLFFEDCFKLDYFNLFWESLINCWLWLYFMFLDMFLLLLALLKVDLISYYSLIYYYDYSSSSIKIYIFCFPRVVLGLIGLDYNDAVGLIEAIIAVVVFNDDANTFRSFLHEFILIFIIF